MREEYKLIKEIYANGLVSFIDQDVNCFEAIDVSFEKLIADDYVDKKYVHDIIDSVKDIGPYVVFVDGIAVPHGPYSNLVKKPGMSLTIFNNDIEFELGKKARIFFSLASTLSDKHVELIKGLIAIIENNELVNELKGIKTEADLMKLLA